MDTLSTTTLPGTSSLNQGDVQSAEPKNQECHQPANKRADRHGVFEGLRSFEQWNNRLSENYVARVRPHTSALQVAIAQHPLYRATNQNPSEVFKPDGRLLPSSQVAINPNDKASEEKAKQANNAFDLYNHQFLGRDSAYVSTTRDPKIAEMYAKGEGEVHTEGMTGPRDWVYVIDPQPQGRDLDAHNISVQIAKVVAARKADADAKINPGNDFLASLATASALSLNLDEELGDDMDDEEREVSVPGFIPSGEVRGAIPRGTNGELDYSNLVKNPHYDADKFGE